MSSIIRCRIEDLERLVQDDIRHLQDVRIPDAIQKTAVEAIEPIRRRVPKAFFNLADSIHAESHPPRTVVDAPHAAAVEVGSRPHTPDFEALVAWVKLRGAQGLTKQGRDRRRFPRWAGPTTAYQATRVRNLLKAEIQRGPNPHSPIDAPEQVARAIAKGIEEHGTRPHWYVKESLPNIRRILHRNVRSRIRGYGRERAAGESITSLRRLRAGT